MENGRLRHFSLWVILFRPTVFEAEIPLQTRRPDLNEFKSLRIGLVTLYIYLYSSYSIEQGFLQPFKSTRQALCLMVDTVIITGKGNRKTQLSGSHEHILLYFRLKPCHPGDASEKHIFCNYLEEHLKNSLEHLKKGMVSVKLQQRKHVLRKVGKIEGILKLGVGYKPTEEVRKKNQCFEIINE